MTSFNFASTCSSQYVVPISGYFVCLAPSHAGRMTAPRRARLLSGAGRQLLEEPLGRHVVLVVPKTVAPEGQRMTLQPTH